MRRSCGTSTGRLEEKFSELAKKGEGAHMAHIYYGDPSEDFSMRLIDVLVSNGADIIELGIPFSDPIADGPIFQAACERALRAGITPDKCMEAVRKVSGLGIPVIVTTYFNIPYVMGFSKFLSRIRRSGAHGLLIPDLPLEEAYPYLKLAADEGVCMILQAAPTTSKGRLRRIVGASSGFLYIISLEGVTGSRPKGRDALRLIRDVKAMSNIPVMVGFGISKGEQAEAFVSAGADGVVVGSAYTRIYSRKLRDPFETLDDIGKLAREIKLGCKLGYARRESRQGHLPTLR